MINEAGYGVFIADEDVIMLYMDSFCNRIRQLIDVINILVQFNKQVKDWKKQVKDYNKQIKGEKLYEIYFIIIILNV